MGVFSEAGIGADQIDNAKPIEQTDRLPGPGLYVCQVKFMKFGKSSNKANRTDGWPMFNFEFSVFDNTGGVSVGGSRSWGMLVDPGRSESSRESCERQMGDIKKAIAAAMGPKKDKDGNTLKSSDGKTVYHMWSDVKTVHIDAIEKNPTKLEGRKFIVEVGPIRKTKQGHDFYPHDFRVYTDEEAARITAAMTSLPPVQANTPAAQQGQPTQQPNIPAPEAEDEAW